MKGLGFAGFRVQTHGLVELWLPETCSNKCLTRSNKNNLIRIVINSFLLLLVRHLLLLAWHLLLLAS